MNRRNLIAAGVAGLSAAAAVETANADNHAENPELAKIRDLLGAHDKAMTAHDLDAVLATLSDDAVVMGTGPGEWWVGKDEIKVAYEHFFKVFDEGQQDFEYNYRQGNLSGEMGFLFTTGSVKGKADGKEFAYPLNVSLTVAKSGDDWKIAAMHFSTLVSGEGV